MPFGAGPAERPNGGAVSAALYEERPLGRVAVGVEVFKGLFKKAAARGEQQQMPLGRWLRSLCPLESLSAGSLSVVETRFRTAGLPTVAAVMDAHLTETQLIALGLTQVRIRKDVLHAIQGARLQRAALSAVRSAADATPVDANATSHANTATRYFSMPSLPASYLLLNSS